MPRARRAAGLRRVLPRVRLGGRAGLGAAPRRLRRHATTGSSRCTRCRSGPTWPATAARSSPATRLLVGELLAVRKNLGLMMPGPQQVGDGRGPRRRRARRRAARPVRRPPGQAARGVRGGGLPDRPLRGVALPVGHPRRGLLGDRLLARRAGHPRRSRRVLRLGRPASTCGSRSPPPTSGSTRPSHASPRPGCCATTGPRNNDAGAALLLLKSTSPRRDGVHRGVCAGRRDRTGDDAAPRLPCCSGEDAGALLQPPPGGGSGRGRQGRSPRPDPGAARPRPCRGSTASGARTTRRRPAPPRATRPVAPCPPGRSSSSRAGSPRDRGCRAGSRLRARSPLGDRPSPCAATRCGSPGPGSRRGPRGSSP